MRLFVYLRHLVLILALLILGAPDVLGAQDGLTILYTANTYGHYKPCPT